MNPFLDPNAHLLNVFGEYEPEQPKGDPGRRIPVTAVIRAMDDAQRAARANALAAAKAARKTAFAFPANRANGKRRSTKTKGGQ